MRFESWLARHGRSVAFVVLLWIAGGALSASRAPVALFPSLDFPRIVVTIDAGDRSADRMAIEVTRLVEEQLRGILGVRGVRSASSRGTAEISVTFEWGRDMVASLLLAESVVNGLVPRLPPGTSFELRRMDPTVFPVIAYSLRSDIRSRTELYELAQYDLRPLIASVEGVAKASVIGGNPRELRVTIDADRLRANELTVSDVAAVLTSSNVVAATGRLEDLHHLYLVMVDAQSTDPRSLGRVVVRNGRKGIVYLDDVATIAESSVPQWTRVVADGRDAVLLQVYQQPRGNTVAIADAVRAVLKKRGTTLPPDVRIANWYDQSDLIVASESSVIDAVLVGVVLACLVIFAVLRKVLVALVALLVVPAVLAMTALLLYGLGQSLNIMTLGGMAAAVGLIVDDVIVVIEHIMARSGKATPLRATGEFTRPLLVSSTVTVIVFAPFAFLSGVTGGFFAALALTMASALTISFLMAWLFVPLLARLFLADDSGHRAESRGRIMRGYHYMLLWGLRRPLVPVLAVIPLLSLGYVAYRAVGSEFMPNTDEGGFVLDYRAQPGLALSDTDSLCRQVEEILASVPEIDTYSRRTGIQLGGGLTEANQGDYFIRLKSGPRRSVDEIMRELRAKIQLNVPGLQVEMAQLMADLLGDLTAVPQPIEIVIYDEDGEKLNARARRVAEAIKKIPGVVDINNGIVPAGDSLQVSIDAERAALEGVSHAEVLGQVRAQLEGIVATRLQRDPQMIGVRAWVPAGERNTIGRVGKLWLRASDGHGFPLRRVATVARVSGEPQIVHDNLRRSVAVTARIEGRDMGAVIADIKVVLARSDTLGSLANYRLGGLYAQQQKAFSGLIVVFAAAVALVFVVLLYAFERFRIVLAMLSVTLTSVCAVNVGLWLTKTPLNISSMMGMTMVVGIVTEVSVFYVSEAAQPDNISLEEALLQAGLHRARPIFMTTSAAILALMPLALAVGRGSTMQQPLAIAIISGLCVQLPLVLLVLPALLRLLQIRPRAAEGQR